MPPAPTPAPHTPCLFLKAGGSAFFSEQCQKLLINSGFNPDWFGDYDHVTAKIRGAKMKIADWNAMPPPEQAKHPEKRPTPEDAFLSQCTASHAIQDGVYRNARDPAGNPGRGNPCASLVQGYTEGTAPCFPGSPSVEARVGDQEAQQRTIRRSRRKAARSRRPTPTQPTS